MTMIISRLLEEKKKTVENKWRLDGMDPYPVMDNFMPAGYDEYII